MQQWIVILEATSGASNLEIDAVRRLVEAVASLQPGALYSPDRYALQIRVRAANPTQALTNALGRWQEEVARIGELTDCTLARAEVMTSEEYALEHDGGRAERSLMPVDDPLADKGNALLGLALLDPVTGLASPELFVHEVDQALADVSETESQPAVLVVALEDVASVAADLSPLSADELRRRVAARLLASVRPTETPARLGRNQFGLLLTNAPPDLVTTMAERLARVLAEPLALDDQHVITLSARVSAAVGAAGDTGLDLVGRAAGLAPPSAEIGDEAGTAQGATQQCSSEPTDVARWIDTDGYLRCDPASLVAMLLAVAREANLAGSLDEAAYGAIQQVCIHTGWAAGRLWRGNGKELRATDVHWPRARLHLEMWAALGPDEPAGGVGVGVGDPCMPVTVAVRRLRSDPSNPGREFTSATVPILIGTEVTAALQFLADQPVDVPDQLAEALTCVGILLGRVVERERMRSLLRMEGQPARWATT